MPRNASAEPLTAPCTVPRLVSAWVLPVAGASAQSLIDSSCTVRAPRLAPTGWPKVKRKVSTPSSSPSVINATVNVAELWPAAMRSVPLSKSWSAGADAVPDTV